MTRQELQQQSLSMIKKYKRVALQWGTGVGKSFGAINIMNSLSSDTEFKVLLVVAESSHKENWQREFTKWGLNLSINITAECYASLKNYRNTEWDLIILDEAHHIGSDLRLDILSDISSKYILLLSATLPYDTLDSIQRIYGKFAVSKVTLQDAIDWDILPEPEIYLIPLELDNTKTFKKTITKFKKKETVTFTEKTYYNYISSQFDIYKNKYLSTRVERFKNLWMQQGSLRKRFLGECKTKASKILLNKIKNNRYICFCTNIKQAEELGGQNTIHSKKKNSLEIINKFNRKEISNLFAIGMAQEGCNLVDIEIGVIIQLDGQERAFIQKLGRSMRAEEPKAFIFYYKNTRDEEYLQKVLEGIDEKYINVIEDLNKFKLNG